MMGTSARRRPSPVTGKGWIARGPSFIPSENLFGEREKPSEKLQHPDLIEEQRFSEGLFVIE